MMDSSEIDLAHPRQLHEAQHRLDVAGEEDARTLVALVHRQCPGSILDGVEIDVHLRRRPHAIQLLLPIAARHLIIHEDDEADVERLAPADHDLSVNEPIVHAIENETHGRLPPPIATIAARPRSSACFAASIGGGCSANAKSSSIGRLAPATSSTSSRSRNTLR